MIDTSIPYIPLIMHKTDADNYPKFELPDGYSFTFFRKGDERKWSEIQTYSGSFSSVERGIEVFFDEFVNGHLLNPEERIIFVVAPNGEYIATASLWDGDHYGKRLQRIHWVAVLDDYTGKGIAKAMLSKLFDLYNEIGFCGFIYLTTGTRNYPAINIYQKFGFSVYDGEKSLDKNLSDNEFVTRNKTGIELLNKMLKR